MTENNSQELLTEDEVLEILKFANYLDGGLLTPMLINQNMQNVSLNPMRATEATLTSALLAPKDSEVQLQAFSQDFEITSQPYKRLLSYLGNILSFDLTYDCKNAKGKEYTSLAYRKDIDIVKKFLDKFDYKKEFTTVVKQLVRNEAFFCSPRFDLEDKHVLQELPSSPLYTMITGRWGYGFIFSLNMNWFLQPGVDLDSYSDFFKQKYLEVYDNEKNIKDTARSIARRSTLWTYWQEVPIDEGWCWKFNPAIVSRVPYFSGLFLDLIQQPLMRELQKNLNMATASKIVIGQVGVLKDVQVNKKDLFNINPDLLGKFLAIVKAAVGDALKVAAAPLEEIQGIEFKSENEMYNSFLKTTMASSGVNSNLVFATDLKMNTIETQLSLNNDEQLMTSLYSQFNDFLNYHINKKTKKYKFNFKFEGTQFYNNRQERLDKQIELSSLGIVLPQKIAAAIGMNPFEFERQLDEAKSKGFVDKLTPIISGFQQSGKDGAGATGRPAKKDKDLTESGSENRGRGSNISKGGKV